MIDIKQMYVILLLLMPYDSTSSTRFKMIHGIGKNYTTEDVQRDENLKYPRKNERIRNILREKWANYYKCLLEKENEERKPEIRRLLEGQNTEFQCDFCPRPFQDYEQIEWKYKPLSTDVDIKDIEYLDLTPEMILTTNKTLKIFNAVENLAGLYACFHMKNILSAYVLEISKNDTTKRVETMLIHGRHFMVLEEKHYQIYYQWTQWTECSVCGRVGKKFKYGTCFISLISELASNLMKISLMVIYSLSLITHHNLSICLSRLTFSYCAKGNSTFNANFRYNLYRKRQSMTSNSSENLNKIDEYETRNYNKKKPQMGSFFEDDNVTLENSLSLKWGPDIIEKFSTGIPCASQYLPKSAYGFVQKHSAVKVLIKYCWEPCQKNDIFVVLDNSGKVAEMVNNSAGIYSLFQTIPHLPPNIERRSIMAEFGKDITIQCPGTSLRNMPVIWKVNDKIIFPEIVANESNERFTIDLVNRIYIKKLRLKDSQIYSCWQQSRLVGTVHLNVEKKFTIGFNHHVILIGILATIGIFLLVGSQILTRELKMRKE